MATPIPLPPVPPLTPPQRVQQDYGRRRGSQQWDDASAQTTVAAAPGSATSPAPAVTATAVAAASDFASDAWQSWFSNLRGALQRTIGTATTTATAAGTAAATAIAQANAAIAAANAAIAGLGDKLNRSAADILTGATDVQTTGGIKAGTMTWDASGNRTGGFGVALTAKGIVGYSSSGPSFAIDATTGNASFAGALSAASGTFGGTLIATNGTFTGTLVSVNGTFTGALTAATGSFIGDISSATGTISGAGINIGGGNFQVIAGTGATTIFAGTFARCQTSNGSLPTAPSLTIQSSGTGPAVTVAGHATGNAINITAGLGGIAQSGGGTNQLLNTVPAATGQLLGSAGAPWNDIYAVNPLHVTSDIREKVILGECDRGLAFIEALETIKFRWKIGKTTVHDPIIDPDTGAVTVVTSTAPGVRYHYGVKAQQLQQLLSDPMSGMHSLADPSDPDSAQAIRSGELLIVLLKAVQELSAEVKLLKANAAVAAGSV